MKSWLLAWRYLSYHRGRTMILLAAMAITMFLPLASSTITARFQKQARARALATPLVVGAKGSRFAVALNALYFRGESPQSLPYSELSRAEQFGLGQALPMHTAYKTRGVTIVGTIPAYYTHRGLVLQSGEPIDRIGDCVVGAGAARILAVQPGDSLVSESENPFDLTGSTPLKMRVTGILAESNSADDDVVFCDLKTAWIMAGIGHGHQTSGTTNDEHTHSASRQNLQQFEEITDANIGSFHFHGKRDLYPITSIILVPDSARSQTLLEGKYLDPDDKCQIIRPTDVIDELLNTIGRIRELFQFGMLCVTIATAMLIGLVLLLSVRLREREMRTMYLLGCSRGTMWRIISCELFAVFVASLSIAFIAAWIVAIYADVIVGRLV